ncbi:hypothetical protein MUDAN_DOGOELCO_03179 [Lactiplantibacillus mudanjiangensis]|uniref:hypothetical protein n=1 Tax=Lactiplantibacillus mudanjiangensis TaxID=1296538 RepID=UPI0010147073|nr:hypothetical protein [Lactiplantibacillus mudanjiangensis]VDG31331.1 hypothetical protein MUDAN_DOGOELCO_03179 [Lactiplantibacillus mudanjiangensis]
MVSKDFKYPIELDHAMLKRYNSTQVELLRVLSDMAGEKAGVAYMQERVKERAKELAKLEYRSFLATDYRSLIETVENDLADRMVQLDKTVHAVKVAENLLTDLLQ